MDVQHPFALLLGHQVKRLIRDMPRSEEESTLHLQQNLQGVVHLLIDLLPHLKQYEIKYMN